MSDEPIERLIEQMKEAGRVRTAVEFEALCEALEQYVQNTEEIEESLETRPKARLEAARAMQDRCSAFYAALAELKDD